jgi:hypothetical protein
MRWKNRWAGRVGALLAGAFLVVGCEGVVSVLTPVTSRYADPLGDQDAVGGGTRYDVVQMTSRRVDDPPAGSYDALQIELTFDQPVLLPAAGSDPDAAGTQLAPYVGFDVDQDTATGTTLDCLPAGGTGGVGTWTGVDFFVASDVPPFRRLASGNLPVVTAGLVVVGEAGVSAAGDTLTITVPLSALGGDDGVTHAVATVGTRFGGSYTFTDCAPNPTGAVITREGASPRVPPR